MQFAPDVRFWTPIADNPNHGHKLEVLGALVSKTAVPRVAYTRGNAA